MFKVKDKETLLKMKQIQNTELGKINLKETLSELSE